MPRLGRPVQQKNNIGHRKFWLNPLEKAGITTLDSDHVKHTNWIKHYKVDTDSYNSVNHPSISQINIYTDGSKTKDHTAAGYAIYLYKSFTYSNF